MFCPFLPDTDDPGAVLCLYKTDNDCVMKFTYSEHASGQSVLTALREPGQSFSPVPGRGDAPRCRSQCVLVLDRVRRRRTRRPDGAVGRGRQHPAGGGGAARRLEAGHHRSRQTGVPPLPERALARPLPDGEASSPGARVRLLPVCPDAFSRAVCSHRRPPTLCTSSRSPHIL